MNKSVELILRTEIHRCCNLLQSGERIPEFKWSFWLTTKWPTYIRTKSDIDSALLNSHGPGSSFRMKCTWNHICICSYEFHMYLIWNFIWISYKFPMNFIWPCPELHDKFVQENTRELHANFIWTSCELHTNYMIVSYALHMLLISNAVKVCLK